MYDQNQYDRQDRHASSCGHAFDHSYSGHDAPAHSHDRSSLHGYCLVPLRGAQRSNPHPVYAAQPLLLVMLDLFLGHHRVLGLDSTGRFEELGRLRKRRAHSRDVAYLHRLPVARAIL